MIYTASAMTLPMGLKRHTKPPLRATDDVVPSKCTCYHNFTWHGSNSQQSFCHDHATMSLNAALPPERAGFATWPPQPLLKSVLGLAHPSLSSAFCLETSQYSGCKLRLNTLNVVLHIYASLFSLLACSYGEWALGRTPTSSSPRPFTTSACQRGANPKDQH
jgi:hypothetical protein